MGIPACAVAGKIPFTPLLKGGEQGAGGFVIADDVYESCTV